MKTRQKLQRLISVIFLAVLILSAMPVIAVPKASAAEIPGTFVSETVLNRVKDKNKYMFVRYCFQNSAFLGKELKSSDITGWDYFNNDDATGDETVVFSIVGNVYGPDKDATWSCEDGNNVGYAFDALGFTNSKQVFCALNAGSDNTAYESCYNGDSLKGWAVSGSELRERFENLVKNKDSRVEGSGSSAWVLDGLKEEEDYIRYYLSFMNQCGIGSDEVSILKDRYEGGDGDADSRYQLRVVLLENGKAVTKDYLAEGQTSSGSQVALWAEISGSEYKKGDGEDKGSFKNDKWPKGKVESCNSVIGSVRDSADAYAKYLGDHPEDAGGTDAGGTDSAKAPDPTCESESGPLGWAICPALRLVDGLIDFLDTTINNLLFINQETYDNDTIKRGWAVMRNIALLLLVPMMIFMVIGTAVGFGPFDPYTVKKALPRMFVAVIFIVISLAITTFGVEISNTVGQGIGNLITSASPTNVNSLEAVFADSGSDTSGESTLFAGAVVGGAVAGLTGVLTFGIFGSFALVTVVALLIGFVILIMRQVILVSLMVIAPLAILVWIFPGNDKLWTIWKSTFIAMLMMYPIIAILIASGRFVAGVISF